MGIDYSIIIVIFNSTLLSGKNKKWILNRAKITIINPILGDRGFTPTIAPLICPIRWDIVKSQYNTV